MKIEIPDQLVPYVAAGTALYVPRLARSGVVVPGLKEWAYMLYALYTLPDSPQVQPPDDPPDDPLTRIRQDGLERVQRHRARLRGEDVPLRRPGPKRAA